MGNTAIIVYLGIYKLLKDGKKSVQSNEDESNEIRI